MKNVKMTILGTVAVLGMTTTIVEAYDTVYIAHPSVYNEPYMGLINASQSNDLYNYLAYEEREPCQNYRKPPMGFYRVGCDLFYNYPKKPASQVSTMRPQPAPMTEEVRNKTVLASYTINFAFDRSAIEPSENATLDQIASEIKRYNPHEVTVGGHTDRAGSSEYNINLSQQRANTVSRVLTNRGVMNRTIDQEAYGETNMAVDTDDGVALWENRRVVVEFLK